jgi:hypothetical protein
MLLGSYMILMQDMTPDQVMVLFAGISADWFESLDDVMLSRSDFALTVRDCL